MTETQPPTPAPDASTVRCSRCERSFPAGTQRCDGCARVLPGNSVARKHGATSAGNSSIFTAEERAEAAKEVDVILEDLGVPPSVTAMFYADFLTEQHLIINALQRYFDREGYLTSRGRPRASLQVMQQAQDRFNRFVLRLEDLAADHASRNPVRTEY